MNRILPYLVDQMGRFVFPVVRRSQRLPRLLLEEQMEQEGAYADVGREDRVGERRLGSVHLLLERREKQVIRSMFSPDVTFN